MIIGNGRDLNFPLFDSVMYAGSKVAEILKTSQG